MNVADLDRLDVLGAVAEWQRGCARIWPRGHPLRVESERIADLLDPPFTIADILDRAGL